MVKIVILGGGFGGVRAALNLAKKLSFRAEITLIDKNNFQLFQPSLYEVASAYGIQQDQFAIRLKKTISILHADIFDGKDVKLVQAEIDSINLVERNVITKGEHVFGYDYLVIALGSRSSDFGIPGVAKYTHKFKSIQDAIGIREKVENLFKEAEKNRNLPVKVTVVGAGFTGVELAAEISVCAKKLAKECSLDGNCSRITILESDSKILPAISSKERQIITDRLTKQGVIIMENSGVEEVYSSYIKLKNSQKLQADLVIWAAGTVPNRLSSASSDAQLNESSGIMVNNDLTIKDHKNVFAIGDNILFVDPKTQRPVPALAYAAIEQGKIVSENIVRNIGGRKLKEYKPNCEVWIAPVGGKFAVAHLRNGINITGFWGWAVRVMVDLKYYFSILSFKKALKLFMEQATVFTRND